MSPIREFLIDVNSSSSSSSGSTNSSSSSSSSSSSAENSSDSDDEHNLNILFPILQILLDGRKRHRIENYIEVVHSWTDAEFKEHLRLQYVIAVTLVDELANSGVLPEQTFGRPKISAEWSFYITLWFLVNTEPYCTLSDRFDVSISSIFRVIRRVMAWILTKLDNIIKWPEGPAIIQASQGFENKREIRNCIGAIDCTHIIIQQPKENAADYCNRKKCFSIILQAVVTSNMSFTNIYCGEPRSLHDARVLRRSSLHQESQNNKE
ncbi:unnamed protein product [Lasius platythorax]|uniref:DDE Tnp4 domain-containing protein n=1 Tax=Lasius platythorax TaxID=488582 RepID=A0AAV2P7S9_9HYME